MNVDGNKPITETAMNAISLTDNEITVVRDVIQNYLSELHTEIAHTDDRDFREALRRRQDLLQGILQKLVTVGRQPG